MVQVEMVKTYFKYENEDNEEYYFLTPNWSPYGCKYDWWVKNRKDKIAGRIIDKRFTDMLTILYERKLKLEKIKNKL
jgi:hypothetical protein